MRDWKQYVREHLPALGLSGAREQEIVEELAQQLDEAFAEALARGLSSAEAEAHAAAQIPDWNVLAREIRSAEQPVAARVPEQWKLDAQEENLRKRRGGNMFADLSQDLRYAARMLRKSPGFAIVVAITLALGIGANTAIFSVINALLLHPFDYKDSGRLVNINSTYQGANNYRVSAADFLELRAQNHSFEQIDMYAIGGDVLNENGEAQVVDSTRVSPGLFTMLGASPLLGRTFTSEEEIPSNGHVVILSHAFWREHYHSDSGVLGKNIQLGEDSYEIVGVMPAGFKFPADFGSRMWKPLTLGESERTMHGNRDKAVIGRLKSGVNTLQMQTELGVIADHLAQAFPKEDKGWGFSETSLYESTVGDYRPALLLLFGAVGFVLLIACANVANLMLARSAARQREMAIRLAIGAGRGRIVRQLLTESLLLAGLGGGIGLAVAYGGLQAIRALIPPDLPLMNSLEMDRWVFGFALLASALAALLFGLAPSLAASKPDLTNSLKEGGSGSQAGFRFRGTLRARHTLATIEITMALVLLMGSVLLLKSFARLTGQNLGLDPRDVYSMDLGISAKRYATPGNQIAYFTQVLERVHSVNRIENASLTNVGFGNSISSNFDVEGHPTSDDDAPQASLHIVSPGYLETLRIPLLKGRFFTEADQQNSGKVAVITESVAKQFFPSGDPIGKHLRFSWGKEKPWREIVGVVGDARDFRLSEPPAPTLYVPYTQLPQNSLTLLMRAPGNPPGAIAAAREQIKKVDGDVPLFATKTYSQAISLDVTGPRIILMLLSSFAGLAVALSMVGIYGVVAYSVGQRTHEIGIRMALGAAPGNVLKRVLGQGLFLAGVGIAAGLAVSFGVTRVLTSLLFGVTPTDPATFAEVAALMLAVAAAACWIPARRATRVDPLAALRHE